MIPALHRLVDMLQAAYIHPSAIPRIRHLQDGNRRLPHIPKPTLASPPPNRHRPRNLCTLEHPIPRTRRVHEQATSLPQRMTIDQRPASRVSTPNEGSKRLSTHMGQPREHGWRVSRECQVVWRTPMRALCRTPSLGRDNSLQTWTCDRRNTSHATRGPRANNSHSSIGTAMLRMSSE